MDNSDIFMIVILTIVILTASIRVYDEVVLQPYRAERAMEYCRENGYERYEDYEYSILQKEIYGVRCTGDLNGKQRKMA